MSGIKFYVKEGLESWKICTLRAPSEFQSIPNVLTDVWSITFKNLSKGDISNGYIYLAFFFYITLFFVECTYESPHTIKCYN